MLFLVFCLAAAIGSGLGYVTFKYIPAFKGDKKMAVYAGIFFTISFLAGWIFGFIVSQLS